MVEEITQIDCFLWCEIAKLLHKGIQFILLGDTRQFSAIAASNSIKFIEGVPRAVQRADQGAFAARAGDRFHWNELGHRAVADELTRHLIVR